MKRLAASLLLLVPALGLAQSFAGGVRPGFGCPESVRCADSVNVEMRPGPFSGQAGAVFIGLLPMIEGEPALPGVFFDPAGNLASGSTPVSNYVGPLRKVSFRASVRGGVCAEARRRGFEGVVALVAGLGLTDERFVGLEGARSKRLAEAKNQHERATIEAAFERVAAQNPASLSAAQEMIAQRRYNVLSTINCTP